MLKNAPFQILLEKTWKGIKIMQKEKKLCKKEITRIFIFTAVFDLIPGVEHIQ